MSCSETIDKSPHPPKKAFSYLRFCVGEGDRYVFFI